MNSVDVGREASLEGSVAGAAGDGLFGQDGGVVEQDLGLAPGQGVGQGLVGQPRLTQPAAGHPRVVDVVLDGVRVLELGTLQRFDLQ